MKRIFENFEITKCGKVIRKKDGKEMKCCVDTAGYVKFSPRFNGEKVQAKVHRLVATLYLENPNGYTQVNHINGIKTDNRVENLEWCTSKHNINHAHQNKLATNSHLKKQVIQKNVNNEIIAIYDSYREASIKTGIKETNISAVCRQYKAKNRPKSRKTAGGFIWERATTS